MRGGLTVAVVYDPVLVALSIVIAILAAYTALDLASRVAPAHGRARAAWLGGGAAAMGLGIWSMHFIGMLAVRLSMPVDYDGPTVLASLLLAIAASGLALVVVGRRTMPRRAWLVGGGAMGLAIAGMHYIGMAAMRMPGAMTYHPLPVALSILTAVVASLVALWLAFHLRERTGRWRGRTAAAALMGLAIAGMHYIGMAAVTFTMRPGAAPIVAAGSRFPAEAVAVGVGAVLVLGLALLTSLADRRLSAQDAAAREQLRTVYEAMACGVLVVDAAGEIVEANRMARDILGLGDDTLRGRGMTETYTGVVVGADEGPLRVDDHPTRVAARTRQSVHGVVMGVARLDGARRWLQADAVPLLRADGSVRQVVMSLIDITARKQAEEALRASEEQLRTIVTSAPLILFALDADGVFTLSEGKALETLGLTSGEVVGLSMFDAYRDYPDVLDYTRRTFAGEVVTYVSRVGGGVWENQLTPLRDGAGGIAGVIGVTVDITARARAEEALAIAREAALAAEREKAQILARSNVELERSNAELRQFAYVASHDLQEPLRTIASYLQLLKRRYAGRVLDEGADEYIAFAVDGAKRMQVLIQAVLAYSRVGTHGKDFAPLDARALVARALANLDARLADTGAHVTVDGDLPTVRGDDAQLGQLFQNLIGNALKFVRSGETPTVAITAERTAEGWTFAVRDNGIGLPPEQAERIFGMFQRLHTRDEYEGTGIGLSVCKRIVERHGGRIWVESRPGEGATFRFTLPAHDEEREDTAKTRERGDTAA